ncbi:MAG: class I tRNA ligase family protein [Planctomycetales bacterium]|nr:class I tRNA ligase family protein [Planctomycetales bacterium]
MSPSADDYPNRFDFATAQGRLFESWERQGYFHADETSDKPPFCIVIPPPNVTGALHLGHALNNSLQDIMIRFKRMQGFEALWMPGTDHAGIATQAVVEKRLKEEEGKTRHDLGREALVERIWQWKHQYEERILGQLKRMGCSCDWERTRFTLDERCAKAVRVTFFDLFDKDRIYRGKRLVNWDTFLQTAVSDDEVFQETVKGHFWHIRYAVIDALPGEPSHVIVATTRPETLLGDTAVAVHPQPAEALDKALTELRDKLAKAAAKEKPAIQAELEALEQRRAEMLPALEQLAAMARDGRMVMLPLLERPIPLVADEWAKPELGSGCVKITPAHDPNDYEVGKRCALPMINILNPDGTLNANAGPYEGATIREARKRVVADLESADQLEKVEDREIELPHSDRSKTPIEPFLADQWFVRMDQLAQSAMDAVTSGEVSIHPARYAKGYLDWLREKRDWPVSRQLWWGHQIPVWSRAWHGEETSQAAAEYQGLRQQLQGLDGVSLQLETTDEGDRATVHVCVRDEDSPAIELLESQDFVRAEDVLDTWFSSALWPHSTLGWPSQTPELAKFYPTSTLITSRDIITLWVARMVLMGLNNVGQVPFRDVFIHPKILDGFGETMSKSKGNGIDPLDVIDKFGADALRYGMAFLTTDTQDVRMPVQFECPHCEHSFDQTKKNRELPRIDCPKCGKPFGTQWARTDEDRALERGLVLSERFEVARNFTNKLWNAARFAILNLEGYTPGKIEVDKLPLEDRWILSRIASTTRSVTEALERFEFSEAARALYEFAWDDFCSFYVEILKDRFAQPESRVVAQRVMAYVLDTLLRLLHPIKPFLTEEIWQRLAEWAPRRGLDPEAAAASVMIAAWPTVDESLIAADIEAQFAKFQAALGALREIRSVRNIPPKADIEFVARCDRDTVALLQPMEPYFASMARATCRGWGAEVEVPQPNATGVLPGIELYVDLKDFINVDEERERLGKERDKHLGFIKSKEAKLGNESFVSRAPADVVQRERDQLEQLREQLAAIDEALAALSK